MIAEPRTSWGKSLTRHDNEDAERTQAPDWIKELFGAEPTPHEVRETVQGMVLHDGDIWIEFEIVQPPSSAGRSITIHIPKEQVLAVLKVCRRAAAQQRKKTL